MKKNLRVALSFATSPDDQLSSFAILVLVCLKNNSLFPDLPLTLTALATLQTTYQNALTTAANGGKIATAAKKEARGRLIAALRQIAAYVQSLGLPDASDVLSSGFNLISFNRATLPLMQPVSTGLDNSISGQLQIYLQAVRNACAYQVQATTGNGVWSESDIFRSTRNVILTSLTPGTVYGVRVRAVGGSERYSPWSATISLMCT